MPRCPEAVFERRAPHDFDRIGLNSVPCRNATARNIRRGELNDGRNAARPLGTWLAHDKGLPISAIRLSLLERRILSSRH
jgi:hypothetical protein